MLEKHKVAQDIWAEIYVLMANCEMQYGRKGTAQAYLRQAHRYEPDNRKMKSIAEKWALEWSQ